jgi:aspartate 1-decarboxylase
MDGSNVNDNKTASMRVELLKSKLHQACVTQADLHYEGSLGVDVELMEAVGLYPHEKILVSNMNNGERLETYIIPEPFGSRRIILNGAAARKGTVGDRIIIMSFCHLDETYVREGRHRPRVIRLDENNEPVMPIPRAPTTEQIAAMLDG